MLHASASSAKTLNLLQLFPANCARSEQIPQLLPLTTIVLVNLCYAWLSRQKNRIQSLSPLGHQFKHTPHLQGPKVTTNRWLFGVLSKSPFYLHIPGYTPDPKSCISLKGICHAEKEMEFQSSSQNNCPSTIQNIHTFFFSSFKRQKYYYSQCKTVRQRNHENTFQKAASRESQNKRGLLKKDQ